MLPMNTNIREAYARGQDAEQNFIQNLAMFLCSFLGEHGILVEQKQLNDVLLKVLWIIAFHLHKWLMDTIICNNMYFIYYSGTSLSSFDLRSG